MPFDIFISHSSKDGTIANAVCAALERNGIACWIAPRNIPGGHDWSEEIFAGIEASRAMILLVSAHSNRSKDVLSEIRLARESGLPVIPLFMENVALSRSLRYFIGGVQWLDATSQPIEPHLDSLAEAIGHLFQEVTGEEPAAASAPESPPSAAVAAAPLPLKEITIAASSDRIYHVRVATSLELGRQAEVSFPLGAFEEARHFTDAQKSSWTRLSRRQVRLSIASAGLTLEDLRDGAARAERVAYFNGAAWPATAGPAVLPPDRQASYEIADVVRWTFHPLRAAPAHPAPTPEIERVVRDTRLGGCEVRVQWPGADATSRHLLFMLWSAAAFTPGSTADGGLFLLARSDGLWLGSLTDASPLMVDSVMLPAGELAPLAPGRQIERPAAGHCAGGASLALTCS